jgi:hypothetical protein
VVGSVLVVIVMAMASGLGAWLLAQAGSSPAEVRVAFLDE